jgi:hypothetical protein
MRLAEVISDGVVTEEERIAVRELVYSVRFVTFGEGEEPRQR